MQIILGLALSAFFVLIPNTCTTNPIYIGGQFVNRIQTWYGC